MCVPRRYVKNKAGLTGQTVPRRRIPGHWPIPVPEALALAEPVTLVSKTLPFSFLYPPPSRCHERVLAKLGRQAARLNLEAFRTKRHGHTPSLACRGAFGLRALLLCVYLRTVLSCSRGASKAVTR